VFCFFGIPEIIYENRPRSGNEMRDKASLTCQLREGNRHG
jgi:hypothetical protein